MPHNLESVLAVERLDDDTFRGWSQPRSNPAVFGGEFVSQALAAAGATVPVGQHAHSVHGHFLLPGNAAKPIDYRVETLLATERRSVCSVVASQDGGPVFRLDASFMLPTDGPIHQRSQKESTLPPAPPEDLECAPGGIGYVLRDFGFEARFAGDSPQQRTARGSEPGDRLGIWLRSAVPLPDTDLTQRCAIAFISDLYLIAASVPPELAGLGPQRLQVLSLDHAMWFHAPASAGEWLLYEQRADWTGASRGLSRGEFFREDGTLVASVTQEGLIRVRR